MLKQPHRVLSTPFSDNETSIVYRDTLGTKHIRGKVNSHGAVVCRRSWVWLLLLSCSWQWMSLRSTGYGTPASTS
jgi:hypothetical protein